MTVFCQDWYLYPVDIVAGANDFRVVEGVTIAIATIPAGRYYLHLDATLHNLGAIKSLFWEVSTRLATLGTLTGNHVFRTCTPTLSSEMTSAGFEFYSTSAVAFSVDFSHVNFTIPPEYFGWRRTDSSAAAVSHKSPWCAVGQWCSRTIVDRVNGAVSKRSYKTLDIEFSHDRVRDRYAIEYDEDDRIRPINYEYVPAAHVHLYGASTLDHASWGKVALGDNRNAFERLWQALARSEPVIIAHNRDYGQWDGLLTAHAEMVKILEPTRSIENIVRLMQTAGELYEISPVFWIDPDSGLPGYAF